MNKKSSGFLKNKQLFNKTIIGGVFSLSVLQIFNLGIPLIRMPFIIKTIGLEQYGIFAFGLAFILYCTIFIDYGFNLYGTERVAGLKDVKLEGELFYNIFAAKVIISVIIFLFYLVIVFSFSVLEINSSLYIILFGIALGNVFFPLWYFHAKQEMALIAKIQVTSQILQTILIFLILDQNTGLFNLALITGLSSLITGFFSFTVAIKKYKITFEGLSFSGILKQIKASWILFLSRLFVNLYSNTNSILLFVIGGAESLAIYTIAERVTKAGSSILSTISTTLLPQMVKLKKQGILIFKNLFYDSVKITFLISSLAFLLTEAFSGFIAEYFSSDKVYEIKITLQILGISLLFEPLGGIYSNLLITLKENKALLNYTIVLSIFNLLLVIPLLIFYNAYGLAASSSFTQFFGFIYLFVLGRKVFNKHINFT